jgi:tripartite-type tricarboxylate transporter receptor subunit TctC
MMLRILVSFLCFFAALPALADTYPSRVIKMISPFPPGAGVDTMARILQNPMEQLLGQPVVIENRPGATGNIGSAVALKAPADGYTLLLGVNGTIVINPFLHKNFPFNPEADIAGVSLLAESYIALVVSTKSSIHTLADLIKEAKQSPGTLGFGSPGYGSTHHILGALLNKNAGIDILHVPYQGTGPAIQNVLGGHLAMAYATLPAVMPFVENGTLRILAVGESKRVPSLPDVPTMAETVPGVVSSTWYGLFVPAGTPSAVIEKLNATVKQAFEDPKNRQAMQKAGFTPVTSTPAELDALIRSDLKEWKAALQRVDIEPR